MFRRIRGFAGMFWLIHLKKTTADNTDSVSGNLDERMCEAWCYFTLQLFISVNGDFDFVLVFICSVLAS